MADVLSRSESAPGSKTLNIALWISQVLVFALFVFSGCVKLLVPVPKLAAIFPWLGQVPLWFLYFTAILDVAGGVGVLLPALTRMFPKLTGLAALGCVTLQVAAMIFHTSRGEFGALPVNFVLLSLSAFILWGRWTKIPILPRG